MVCHNSQAPTLVCELTLACLLPANGQPPPLRLVWQLTCRCQQGRLGRLSQLPAPPPHSPCTFTPQIPARPPGHPTWAPRMAGGEPGALAGRGGRGGRGGVGWSRAGRGGGAQCLFNPLKKVPLVNVIQSILLIILLCRAPCRRDRRGASRRQTSAAPPQPSSPHPDPEAHGFSSPVSRWGCGLGAQGLGNPGKYFRGCCLPPYSCLLPT